MFRLRAADSNSNHMLLKKALKRGPTVIVTTLKLFGAGSDDCCKAPFWFIEKRQSILDHNGTAVEFIRRR